MKKKNIEEGGKKETDISEIMKGSNQYSTRNKKKNVKPPKSLF
jgi:hypothetical protein